MTTNDKDNDSNLKMSSEFLKDAFKNRSEEETLNYKHDYKIEKWSFKPNRPFPIGAFFVSIPILGLLGLLLYSIVMLFVQ